MSGVHYIDDNKMLLEMFEDVMDFYNQNALTFSCPLEYLEYVDSPEYKKPFAIFTDIQMPQMNGHQLIEQIRARFPDLRFITVSGYDDTLANTHKPACMHIHKPFNHEVLINTVESLTICNGQGPESTEKICAKLNEQKHYYNHQWKCPKVTEEPESKSNHSSDLT